MATDEASTASLQESIEVLSKTKSDARTRVKLLRALAAEGDLSRAKLREQHLLYSNAQAAINASIDGILVVLVTRRQLPSPEAYERAARSASSRADVFLRSSESMILGELSITDVVVAVVPNIVTALVGLRNAVRGDAQRARAALIDQLKALKWADFDDIESSETASETNG